MLILSGHFKEIAAVRQQVQRGEPYMGNHHHGYRYWGMEDDSTHATLMLEPVGNDVAGRRKFVATLRQFMPSLTIENAHK